MPFSPKHHHIAGFAEHETWRILRCIGGRHRKYADLTAQRLNRLTGTQQQGDCGVEIPTRDNFQALLSRFSKGTPRLISGEKHLLGRLYRLREQHARHSSNEHAPAPAICAFQYLALRYQIMGTQSPAAV